MMSRNTDLWGLPGSRRSDQGENSAIRSLFNAQVRDERESTERPRRKAVIVSQQQSATPRNFASGWLRF